MADDVGSLGDEAARLADAVRRWARGEAPGRASAAVGHVATGDAACCACPVCQVVVLLRGERPELTGRLVESVTGLVVAGQGLVDTVAAVAAEARAGTGRPTDSADSADVPADTTGDITAGDEARADAAQPDAPDDGPAPRVQRIRLD